MAEIIRPDVLLIPGMTGSGRLFDGLGGRLFPGSRLTVFDHYTDNVIGGIEGLAQRALDCVGDRAGPMLVCGESFGGPVALTMARRFPTRVRGVVLLSTFAYHPVAGSMRARAAAWAWQRILQRAAPVAHLARATSLPGQLGCPVSPWVALRYLRSPLPLPAPYGARFEAIRTFDARPWLHEITCPALVVVSTRDPIVPARAGIELARRLPCATMHALSCGHLAFLVRPDAIGRFFSRWVDAWLQHGPAHDARTAGGPLTPCCPATAIKKEFDP